MARSIGILIICLICASRTQAQVQIETRYKDRPIIQMTLNEKKIWVLLDTGSSMSLLNIRAAGVYGFQASFADEAVHATGFGSQRNELAEVCGARLYYHDVRLHGQFFAYDISNIVTSIHQNTGKKISAILGTDMMRRYEFVIDMGNRTVSMNFKPKKRILWRP